MAKIKFVGDDYSQHTEVFGTVFPVGVPTAIDHLEEHQQARLKTNPMFVAVDDDAPDTPPERVLNADEPAPAPPVDTSVPIPSDWQALDFMSLKALARKIDPSLTNDATKDACVASIEAELGRREPVS